ncbi:MAG: ABC transporter substrate-binding protein [Thermofilum sp.]
MRSKLAIALVIALVLSAACGVVLAQPQGPWVDEVIFFREPDPAKVVDMLVKGDMHIYFSDVRADPALLERIRTEPALGYKYSYGLYFELTFNPVGPEFPATGKLNPFSNPRIREAMNWLVDRNYIVNEIMGGFARPKLLPIVSAFPDYARLAETAKLLEAEYSYNFEKAKEVIFEEMVKMGAEFKEGKWYYKGEPVTVTFLIRVEDQRRAIGDYVASQLEKLGFTVERRYGRSRELAPLWIAGNPADGKWHIYTGGWITTLISRDDADNFGFFYTPLGALGPLWSAYKPDPLFYEVATRLWNRDYKTIEERQELMAKAAVMALKDSVRVWLVDQIVPWVYRKEVSCAADLSSGFDNYLWPMTLRFVDKTGGSVKIGMREVLVDPWNPVAGTNWIYDAVIIWAVNDYWQRPNPYTGLPMANRLVSAEVYVEKGVPTAASSDWLKLTFVDKVEVPADAWWGYDVATGKVITSGEAGVKVAKVKVVANYGSVIGKIKYHDGTVMSLADWLIGWPLTFARVDPKSPLYDESALEAFNAWRSVFAGWRIVSQDPLIIEYYGNYTSLDAEYIVGYFAGWPANPWHMLAIGIRAEEKGLLAFSSDKADKLKVEWMNYIGGPSLEALSKMLDEAIAESYIPFKEYFSKYVTPADAKSRYEALKRWYSERGHFWVGNGPFYLFKVDYTAGQVILRANREYPDKADRWAFLAEPPIPEVKVTPPEAVVPGLAAEFKVSITFKGAPYPNARMDFVRYLVMDAAGNILAKGSASPAAEGVWSIKLSEVDTGKMTPGGYRIMVIALSRDVAMPATIEAPFIATSQIAYFQTLLAAARSALEARIGSLEAGISDVNRKVGALESSAAALQSNLTIAIALAVIALLLSAAGIAMVFRKPKAASPAGEGTVAKTA